MAYMGMLVVAGHRFPVTSLALRGGQLVVTAEGPGPCPAFRNEPVTVFGEDDVGLVQGGYMTTTREAGPRDRVQLFVRLSWTKTTDEGPFS
jgi:hypothetical protein